MNMSKKFWCLEFDALKPLIILYRYRRDLFEGLSSTEGSFEVVPLEDS